VAAHWFCFCYCWWQHCAAFVVDAIGGSIIALFLFLLAIYGSIVLQFVAVVHCLLLVGGSMMLFFFLLLLPLCCYCCLLLELFCCCWCTIVAVGIVLFAAGIVLLLVFYCSWKCAFSAVDIMLLSLLAVSALLFLLVVAACVVGILNGTPVII